MIKNERKIAFVILKEIKEENLTKILFYITYPTQ